MKISRHLGSVRRRFPLPPTRMKIRKKKATRQIKRRRRRRKRRFFRVISRRARSAIRYISFCVGPRLGLVFFLSAENGVGGGGGCGGGHFVFFFFLAVFAQVSSRGAQQVSSGSQRTASASGRGMSPFRDDLRPMKSEKTKKARANRNWPRWHTDTDAPTL